MMDSITLVGGGMLEAGKAGRIEEQRERPCGYYMLRTSATSSDVKSSSGNPTGANRFERVRGG